MKSQKNYFKLNNPESMNVYNKIKEKLELISGLGIKYEIIEPEGIMDKI